MLRIEGDLKPFQVKTDPQLRDRHSSAQKRMNAGESRGSCLRNILSIVSKTYFNLKSFLHRISWTWRETDSLTLTRKVPRCSNNTSRKSEKTLLGNLSTLKRLERIVIRRIVSTYWSIWMWNCPAQGTSARIPGEHFCCRVCQLRAQLSLFCSFLNLSRYSASVACLSCAGCLRRG